MCYFNSIGLGLLFTFLFSTGFDKEEAVEDCSELSSVACGLGAVAIEDSTGGLESVVVGFEGSVVFIGALFVTSTYCSSTLHSDFFSVKFWLTIGVDFWVTVPFASTFSTFFGTCGYAK